MVVPVETETPLMVPLAVSVFVSVKSLVFTFFTLSLKVTRNVTLLSLVVSLLGLWRLMELTVGAVLSTNTPLKVASVKVGLALLPAPSLSVPPLSTSGELTVTPSVSFSPACTTYSNTSAVVVVPDL